MPQESQWDKTVCRHIDDANIQPLPNTRKRYRAKKNARSGLERARSIFDDVATVSAYLQRLGTPVIKDLNAFLNAGVDPISVQTVLRQ